MRPPIDEPVQPGADEAAIAAVRERLRSLFGATLPDAYADLLRREDGVDVDGLVLYGSWQSPEARGPGGFWQGLVAANTLWRDVPGREGYLVLGDSDLYLLTVDLDGGAPVLRDRVTAEPVESFPDVATAIEHVLAPRR
ncbi:YrhA family protein [Pseudonocardia hierapolitana]|uniref:YrhA family protein n=1 Tax=Pseudonocardia hierapolitana TaxID=1128676 RepID=UPI0011BE9C6E|nr:YrhA family protein [Pseudonocardia hierapolitana]